MTGRTQTLILGILAGAFVMYAVDRAPDFIRQQNRQQPAEPTMSNPADLDSELRRRLPLIIPEAVAPVQPSPLEGMKPCSLGSKLCWLLQ